MEETLKMLALYGLAFVLGPPLVLVIQYLSRRFNWPR